jgi:hypothetical protein
MYFDRFPDMPITLPLTKMGDKGIGITMPSYAYKGYLIYGIGTDSIKAREYFQQYDSFDSIALKIPNQTAYQLHINQ